MIGDHIFESYNKDYIKKFQKIVNPDYWERGMRIDPETRRNVYILSWTIIDEEECDKAWKRWEDEKRRELTRNYYLDDNPKNTLPHVLVDLTEASSAIIDFVGTEDCDEVVSSLKQDPKSCFIFGLTYAFALMNAKCKVYYYDKNHKKGEKEK